MTINVEIPNVELTISQKIKIFFSRKTNFIFSNAKINFIDKKINKLEKK